MLNSVQMYSYRRVAGPAFFCVPPLRAAGLVLLALGAIGQGSVLQAQEAAAPDLERDLTQSMQAQCAAWNRGDLDEFMAYYWKSEQLTFSSGGQVTRGWQQTLDRYHRTYRAAQKMGHLEFSELEVTPLGDSAALMLGRWQLTDNGDPAGGIFSLVWRKIDGQWRIIHDHTSQSPPKDP